MVYTYNMFQNDKVMIKKFYYKRSNKMENQYNLSKEILDIIKKFYYKRSNKMELL